MITADIIHVLVLGTGLGIALGFPVGPLGILIAQRMVLKGLSDGYVTILGVLGGDLFYASVILFKLDFVISWLFQFKTFLELFVVASLLWIGYKTLRDAEDPMHSHQHSKKELLGELGSALLLSIATPTTPLVFAAVYALLNVPASVHTTLDKCVLLAGISVGVFLWWWGFSAIVKALRKRGYLKTHAPLFKFFGWALIVIALVISVFAFVV